MGSYQGKNGPYFLRKYVAPCIGIVTGKTRYFYYHQIKGNEWLSLGKLEHLKHQLLSKLLLHAKSNVPFYQKTLAGGDMSSGHGIEDSLVSYPIVTKKIIQEQDQNMISQSFPPKKTMVGYTGGSTGNPLKLYFNASFLEKKEAAFMRSLTWGGWEPGEPVVMFWGGLRELRNRQSKMAYVKSQLTGFHVEGCYEYDDNMMDAWLHYLADNGIKFIYGYASVIDSLATYQKKRKLAPIRLRGVFSTAEMLMPQYRKNIEESFQCKVYDQYGSREVVNIAAECEEGNMHILSDMVFPEFIRENGNSQHQTIVLTSFCNYVMPFIRYNIEDYVSPKVGHCSCGRSFPMIRIDVARNRDHLQKPDGTKVHPSYFTGLLYGIEGIDRYQYRQVDYDRVVLEIVKNSAFKSASQQVINGLKDRIAEDLSWDVDLAVKEVEGMQLPDSGKHRYVVSDISSQ